MAKGNDDVTLDGTVETDGGVLRLPRLAGEPQADRGERDLAEYREADRRVSWSCTSVVAARCPSWSARGRWRGSSASASTLGANLHADERPHSDALGSLLRRTPHQPIRGVLLGRCLHQSSRKATSPACDAPSPVSSNTARAATCTSIPMKPRGARITPASPTAHSTPRFSTRRSASPVSRPGRGTGSGRP